MARKKAKAKKAGKASKAAAGAKLPKKLSLSGEALASVITSPVVREMAADVLIAVAGAIAANRRPQQAAANVADNAADTASAVAGGAKTATEAVAGVVAEAARRILPSAAAAEEKGESEGARPRGYPRPANDGSTRKRKPRAEAREH